jgi:mycothiol synthase
LKISLIIVFALDGKRFLWYAIWQYFMRREEPVQEEILERQYVFRQYMPTKDIPHLSHLLTEVEGHDHDGEETSETALREQLTWPNHHPEQDCWVIEAHDSSHTLIGYGSAYAQSPERSTLYIAIHPAWRRRGLGRSLLTKVLQRARETEARQVKIAANAHNPAANAFLRKSGFRQESSSWILQAPADLVLENISWPAGYTVRTYAEVQQISTLVDAKNGSYTDRWGHSENTRPTTEANIRSWIAHADMEGIFLAFAPDGGIAGFCRAISASLPQEADLLDSTCTDEIEQPGVVLEHRHQDLYRPLALTAMHWLREKARRSIILLSWGDDEQTIATYQGLGFLMRQHYLDYRYNLYER